MFFDREQARKGFVAPGLQAHIMAGVPYPVVMLGAEVVELSILTRQGSQGAWVRARDVHRAAPP